MRLRDRVEVPVVQGGLDEVADGAIRGAAATASVQSGLLRTYALAFTVAVADPDARLPGGPLMLTTALIVVPLAGAILVWVLPLSRESTSGLALLVALAEVGLWLGSARNFDFGSDAPQYSTTREWFDQLGISYSVGLYGFQFWLVGLAIVVGACAIGYGAWAERERSRAYFGLLLFLVGSLVGVFAAQDLIVFYVFFEAMLIPIYVLVGVWGGAERVKATVTFVIYTMVGSLLMLASIVALGVSKGTFELADLGTSSNDWIFLGFLAAFAVKAPLLPFHGWLRLAYTQAPPEVAAILSGVVSKAAVFGLVWIVLPALPRAGRGLPHARPRPRRRDARLRLGARLPPAGHPRCRRVLLDGPDGPHRARDLRGQRPRAGRRRAPLRQPRARLGGLLPARRDDRDARRHRRASPSSAAWPRAARSSRRS